MRSKARKDAYVAYREGWGPWLAGVLVVLCGGLLFGALWEAREARANAAPAEYCIHAPHGTTMTRRAYSVTVHTPVGFLAGTGDPCVTLWDNESGVAGEFCGPGVGYERGACK